MPQKYDKSALIRRLRSKGLTFAEIARLANCSQGSVSVEIKAWEKEKAEGIEQNFEDEEILGELLDHPKDNESKKNLGEEVPAEPVPVIRY